MKPGYVCAGFHLSKVAIQFNKPQSIKSVTNNFETIVTYLFPTRVFISDDSP